MITGTLRVLTALLVRAIAAQAFAIHPGRAEHRRILGSGSGGRPAHVVLPGTPAIVVRLSGTGGYRERK
jgi:hypothetical protein